MSRYQCQIGVFFVSILFFLMSCDKIPLTNNENESEKKTISGFVQKGPFIEGSTLIIQILDEALNPTGKTYHTQILNSMGEFSISVNTMDSLFEFIAQGFYFNEITNSLSQNNLTLRAIAKINEKRTVNVNTLTYMITERVKYLINQKGYTFDRAKKQAERELLANFNIPIDHIVFSSGFEELDIAQPDESNAVLLVITCILLSHRTTAEFTELMANIASDIREDGIISDPELLDDINCGRKINCIQVKNNLRARYKSLGVKVSIPDLERYCDSDGDGILNFEDSDFTMITRIDKNGHIYTIDETDWGYEGEYQVGDTINLSFSSNSIPSIPPIPPTKYKLLPPFPNPATLHDTLSFYYQLPKGTYLRFYAFNAQGDTIKLVNETQCAAGNYKLNIATTQFQLGYYEVFFDYEEGAINGTILFEEE